MESSSVPQGKVFVGGISVETTEETLAQHFGRYGEVVKSQIIKYRETGLSKGFGFVTFADSSVIAQILQDQHIILGRTVDVKLALPKGHHQCQLYSERQQIQGHVSETSRSNSRKIFVGGLPHNLSEEEFKSFFGSFGRIEDAKLIFHKETNKPRGFGFVTYDSEETVTNVLQQSLYLLKHKYVEVKRAVPREWRVLDTSNYYYNFYPRNPWWPIYDCYGSNAPHYWPNHTMVPSWSSHLGANVPVPQPVPYFMPSQVDENWGSSQVSSTFAHNSGGIEYQEDVTNERNNDNHQGSQYHNSVSHDQDCNNTEVQLVANGSPRAIGSAKPLEKEVDNGEKDKSVKDPQANTKAENDEEDHSMKVVRVNREPNNGEKDYIGKSS